MIIVGGPASNGIDDGIAKLLSLPIVKVQSKIFPDGESYVRVPETVKDNEVVLVQSTFPEQDKRLMELFFISEALKDMGATKIHAVVPYLAYSRQDRRFMEGEAISVKTVLRLISQAGADSLLTVEPHHEEEMKYFSGQVRTVSPYEEIGMEIKKHVSQPFVLAPDRSALSRAERIAKIVGGDFSFIEKIRDKETGKTTIKEAPNVNLKGKDVILVDDVISTGGTIAQAAEYAYERGANSVIASACHVLLVNDSKSKLKKAGVKKIFGTNTVKNDEEVITVDISKTIALSL